MPMMGNVGDNSAIDFNQINMNMNPYLLLGMNNTNNANMSGNNN